MSALLLVLYQVLATTGLLLSAPFWAWRWIAHPAEMRERFGGSVDGPGSRPLWLHAASLGELEGMRALWEDPDRRAESPLLLTVTSTSARRRAEALAPSGCSVRYAPLDLWCCLHPFLRRWKPRGLVLIETELWPYTLWACRHHGIPVALISGRISARKWVRTRRLGGWLRPGLAALGVCATQSEADAARFRSLGARPIVTGNLKHRLRAQAPPERISDGRFVFVAGSLRHGEEEILTALGDPGILAVIAPRHLRERSHWIDACAKRGLAVFSRRARELEVPPRSSLDGVEARRSLRAALAAILAGSSATTKRGVLLLDVHGELASWYAVADAAFVGGTLCAVGGHNLFEPAREAVPIAFGPSTQGVQELAEPLLRRGGGCVVSGGADLARWLAALREDPEAARRSGLAAFEAAREAAGAWERTWPLLEPLPWMRPNEP